MADFEVVILWRNDPVTVSIQVKIKKCEFEAEREVNPHTQSPHSHCPPWCASGGIILRPPDYEGFWWYSISFLYANQKGPSPGR